MNTLKKLPNLRAVSETLEQIKFIDFVPDEMTEFESVVPEVFEKLESVSGNGFVMPHNLSDRAYLESLRVFLPDDGSDCHKLWKCTGLTSLALYGS